MRLHYNLYTIFLFSLIFIFHSTSSSHDNHKKPDSITGTIEGLKIDNIMTEELELAEGTEVVITHLVIPPNTTLPKHWHPGEEFVYILEGSGILWQQGKPDVVLKKGDAYKVPLKQVHTAKTLEESVTILVFRVHEKGKPVRINVE
jgi:quercetin dioxygenase-like cupin family protein